MIYLHAMLEEILTAALRSAGRGSTFHVFFPCHTSAAVNP